MARKMVLVPIERYQEDHKLGQRNEPAPLDIEVILSAVPKNYRNRARSLLNHIMADPQQRLQWNGRGEIIHRGKVIHNSHITDLLKNSQRKYRHLRPVGQAEFIDVLKELNIPLGLMDMTEGPPGIPARMESQKDLHWLKV